MIKTKDDECAICGYSYGKDKYRYFTTRNMEKIKADMIHTFVGNLCPDCFNPTLDEVIKMLVCGEYTSATKAIEYTMRRQRVLYWRNRFSRLRAERNERESDEEMQRKNEREYKEKCEESRYEHRLMLQEDANERRMFEGQKE